MVVRELLTRLGFQLDNAAINRAEQATNRIRDRADVAANAFRNIALAIGSIATVRSIITIGDQMQSLEARIGLLPQTVNDAGETLDHLVDRANMARMPIQAYGNLYVRLAGSIKNFMTTQAEAIQVTDAIAQALVVSGTNAQEAASATLQLSQAFQKGKLDGDEFRAFMENLSQDFKDKLAYEIGTTADKLFDLSSSGQLTAKKLAEAFKRMAPEIEKQLLTIPLTVGQATAIVTNKFERMIARMNRESMFITKIADTIIKGFDKVEKGINKMVKAFDGWDNALRFISVGLGLATIVLISFGSASWKALLPWLAIAAAILLATIVIDDLLVMIKGGNSVIGRFVSWLQSGESWAKAMAMALTILGGAATVWLGIIAAKYMAVAFAAGLAGAAAIASGVRMAAAWVMALGPIGLLIAAIGLVVYGITKIAQNWDSIKNFAKGLVPSFSSTSQGVTPGSMQSGSPVNNAVTNNTTVNLTVPPGTPQEQANFLAKASEKYFSSNNKYPSAADMAVLAP